MVALIVVGLCISLVMPEKNEKVETIRSEYGAIVSTLENHDECYLCGEADGSMMGYYRKFDSLGVIGLNEWNVIDLRIREYDDNGKEIINDSSSSMLMGNSQGVSYKVDSNSLRGMSRASFSSDDKFNPTVITKNLCQECLDKVADTLVTYQTKGQNNYQPFVLVDFSTLEVYPMQKENLGYMVRDYWVSLDHDDEVKVEAYYLPKR